MGQEAHSSHFSLRFNCHFPGGLGLAGTRKLAECIDSGFYWS